MTIQILNENDHDRLPELVPDKNVNWALHPIFNPKDSKRWYDSYIRQAKYFILIKADGKTFMGFKAFRGYGFFDIESRWLSNEKLAQELGISNIELLEKIEAAYPRN